MKPLWHYTCEHALPHIVAAGKLVPNDLTEVRIGDRNASVGLYGSRQGPPLLWLTDMAPPIDRDALGLTSTTLNCDRSRFGFIVSRSRSISWPEFCARYPVNGYYRAWLERGRDPSRWFVAIKPLHFDAVVEVTPGLKLLAGMSQ